MIKTTLFLALSAIFLFTASGDAKTADFQSSGEVTSVDPLYSRVTIKHGAIKGFTGVEETEFIVSEVSLLKDLGRRDLVDFAFTDADGGAMITKITKTGVAAPEEKVGMGRVVQDVLVGTGEVAKTVTRPITPAHDVVSGTFDATTSVTGSVLNDADTQARQDF